MARDGRSIFEKRRRWGAAIVISLGNIFLFLAGSGIRMFVWADQWLQWELHCYRLLYSGRMSARVGPGGVLLVSRAQGVSLRAMLRAGESTVDAFAIAAREFRRVHAARCGYFGGGWSHGDPHLDNIICDLQSGQAVLIDFDTRHQCRLDPRLRHVDDLRVVLLELIGGPAENWLQLATAFLAAYDQPEILRELGRQLEFPRGFARIFWYTRSDAAPRTQIESRLRQLRELIDRDWPIDDAARNTPIRQHSS